MSTLEEIRRKLREAENRSSNKGNSDKLTFPHWDMQEGASSTIRFLPDGNPDNTYFWVEKQIIKLVFPGIKGHDTGGKPVEVQVPCMEMYGESCPIVNELKPWWKDPTLEATARKYWKKRSYIFQGVVKQNSVKDDEEGENPIRKFVIGPQIFPLIKAALLDPELEEMPTHYVRGLDFIITKTSKGGYPDYTTSKWARKETALSEEHVTAISTHGLVDLATYLPKKPTPDALSAIFDMFTASLDGELYDPDLWAKYYKPYGFDTKPTNSDSETSNAAKAPARNVPAPESEGEGSDEIPFDQPTKVTTEAVSSAANMSTTGKTPKEILEMLRNRPAKAS